MNYDAYQTERRRLEILRQLLAAASYTLAETVLQADLERIGYGVSRDRLRADLAWLAEQDCVILQKPGGVWVATLTHDGYDTARGLKTVPGIARPRPGE